MLDRLRLDEERVEAMAKGLESIVLLPDPVGRIIAQWDRPNGLNIQRVAVPLGVIGIIYESRPNVTADAAALDADFAKRGVATFEELLDAVNALGGRFIVCEMGLRALGLEKSDLRDDIPIELAGVVTFLNDASGSGSSLFI